ncbi:rhamnosyltransferase [Thermomonas brevis]
MGDSNHETRAVQELSAAMQRLAAITVTHAPDHAILDQLLAGLPAECMRIVVDNPAQHGAFDPSRLEVGKLTRVVRNVTNVGLAAALNRGVDEACRLGAEWLLLLDQDSEPLEGAVQCLLEAHHALESAGLHVGAVGPAMIDADTGGAHGFHAIRGMVWRRLFPGDGNPVSCHNLNGSGTLMRADLYRRLGGLETGFFIDHLDTEWSFRILAHGHGLYGVPRAQFHHRMGEATRRIWWLGKRPWPQRSPRRHYYLYRNAVRLMGRDYVPLLWKLWAVPKLVLTACVEGGVSSRGRAQLGAMARGVRDGLRHSCGPMP